MDHKQKTFYVKRIAELENALNDLIKSAKLAAMDSFLLEELVEHSSKAYHNSTRWEDEDYAPEIAEKWKEYRSETAQHSVLFHESVRSAKKVLKINE